MRFLAAVIALSFFCGCGGAQHAPAGAPLAGAGDDSPGPAPGAAIAPGATLDPAAGAEGGRSAAVGPAGPDAGGAYVILLKRPRTVGDRRKHHTVAMEDRLEHATLAGKQVKKDERRMRVTFIAVERVLDVGDKGQVTRSEFTIESFIADNAKGGEPVLPPGAVLSIEKARDPGSEPKITSTSDPLTPQQLAAIDLAVSTKSSGGTADDIFPAPGPQKPGGIWAIAAERASKDMSKMGFEVLPSKITGETRFVGVREERGVPCLELASVLEAHPQGLGGLPPGSKVEKGSLRMVFTGLLPVDQREPSLRDSKRMEMDMRLTIPSQEGPVAMVLTMRRSSESTYEAVP